MCFISHVLLPVYSVYKRFRDLDPVAVGQQKNAKLPKSTIMELQELKVTLDIKATQSPVTFSYKYPF